MADAQKSYRKDSQYENDEKVHIPDSFDDSDTDNDSFTLKVSKLTGLGDTGQSSSKDVPADATNQLWKMDTEINDNVNKEIMTTCWLAKTRVLTRYVLMRVI